MSSVIVIVPVIVGSWPMISAAVTAAIGTTGFTVLRTSAEGHASVRTKVREEIDIEESEILEQTAGTAQEMVVERDGVRAIFRRDASGALKVCMEGEGCSKAELRQIGEELVGRVTQQFVYHRVVTEMKNRNMAIVDEEVTEDRTVRIRVRNS